MKQEDGGQIISGDDCVGFYADRKVMNELERYALQLARSTEAKIRLEVHFNPDKSQAVINVVLLNLNKT